MVRDRLFLTYLWWLWGILLIVVFTALSAAGRAFEGSEGLEWLLPNIMPTMTLVGAAAYTKRGDVQLPDEAKRPLALLAKIVSIGYLAMVTVTLFVLPFSGDPIGFLLKWNLGLAPLQALCASVLGVFFIKND